MEENSVICPDLCSLMVLQPRSKSYSEEIFHLGRGGPCEVEESVIMLFSGAAISLGAWGRWPAPPCPSAAPPLPTFMATCLSAWLHVCSSACQIIFRSHFYMLALCVCV